MAGTADEMIDLDPNNHDLSDEDPDTDTIGNGQNAVTQAEIPNGGSSSYVSKVAELNKLPSNQSYSSFKTLKSGLGSAGEGFDWHHIVEQCQIVKSGFSSSTINNTSNVVAVSRDVHRQISGYYNTKSFYFTNGLSVRNWLAGKSFAYQVNFGLYVLEQFGVKK